MLTAQWAPYSLQFKFLARTSREAMRTKPTYFVRLTDSDTGRSAWGECALFRGLSADDTPDYEERLSRACRDASVLPAESSIRFGWESALRSLGDDVVPTPFMRGEEGIPINGLIWMGDREEMRRRIDEKLAAGFHVLKLKIGGIDFDAEMGLLRYIRGLYSPEALELRLDANGSFAPEDALRRLDILSRYSIHSIEQPVKAGRWDEMARICRHSPIPVALDEELIGVTDHAGLLDAVAPQYIILKPALCGGLSGADAWADEADRRGIGWWATSALESNVGLYAIACWLSARGVEHPQGLGTGMLYHNNIASPLELRGERLYYNPAGRWEYPELAWRQ